MFKEIFESVAKQNHLTVCRSCGIANHKRGFVSFSNPNVVHIDREFATRSTLHRGLHEIGHALQFNKESGIVFKRRYEQEQFAEDYAKLKFKELGIRLPRELVASGRDYVARKKRHGDNIRLGQFGG